jgi:hypothetical protein
MAAVIAMFRPFFIIPPVNFRSAVPARSDKPACAANWFGCLGVDTLPVVPDRPSVIRFYYMNQVWRFWSKVRYLKDNLHVLRMRVRCEATVAFGAIGPCVINEQHCGIVGSCGTEQISPLSQQD